MASSSSDPPQSITRCLSASSVSNSPRIFLRMKPLVSHSGLLMCTILRHSTPCPMKSKKIALLKFSMSFAVSLENPKASTRTLPWKSLSDISSSSRLVSVNPGATLPLSASSSTSGSPSSGPAYVTPESRSTQRNDVMTSATATTHNSPRDFTQDSSISGSFAQIDSTTCRRRDSSCHTGPYAPTSYHTLLSASTGCVPAARSAG